MEEYVPDGFNPFHHEKQRSTFCALQSNWISQTMGSNPKRCKICWLRVYDCFCPQLKRMRECYTSEKIPDFLVCIYYHYLEIGRSANTAHIFEPIFPSHTESLVFGDIAQESALVDSICHEFEHNRSMTCILYPSADAQSLDDWLKARNNSKDKVRLVVLDGTYSSAKRQVKHLTRCLALRGINAPFVKLDLDDRGCKSAIAGLMYQPAMDKICSFQAIILALKQIGLKNNMCNNLLSNLEDWIAHILTSKVKLGKSKIRKALRDVDQTPADYIKLIKASQSQIILKDNQRRSNFKSYEIKIDQTARFTIWRVTILEKK
eukprot:gene6748-9245_t